MFLHARVRDIAQRREHQRLQKKVIAGRLPLSIIVLMMWDMRCIFPGPTNVTRNGCREQTRQCTYNVTLRHIRLTTDVVETQQCILYVLLCYMLMSAA